MLSSCLGLNLSMFGYLLIFYSPTASTLHIFVFSHSRPPIYWDSIVYEESKQSGARRIQELHSFITNQRIIGQSLGPESSFPWHDLERNNYRIGVFIFDWYSGVL